jgi:glycerol-3-phosphate dehydrogenase (NAD(P)+)
VLLANNGHEAFLLCRTVEEARRLRADGENKRFRPGLRFPDGLRTRNRPDVAVEADMVVIAVPAHALRDNIDRLQPFIRPGTTVVSAAKGIEPGSGLRMSEVIAAGGVRPEQVCALSGPNFSAEIAAGLPAATVVAGSDPARVALTQAAFMSERFRVYSSTDVIGVELGGALKNVAAIACGIADGLGCGENSKAALMTRALAEIARLGVACGARAGTFLGLSGIGDLIATCGSGLSRNRRLGLAIAAGQSLETALASIDGVVEGVGTARAVRVLARARAVEMPIAEELHAVLFEGKPAGQSMLDLLRREGKAEFPG